MRKIFKFAMFTVVALTLSTVLASCGDDDDDPNSSVEEKELQLAVTNKQFVDKTVIATYKALADACEELQDVVENMTSQSSLEKACDLWKSSRQYWEWSEAFLFGAASGYSIDPHIDTWPFDVTAFNNVMSKFHPATNPSDAEAIDHLVATTQNFTGFHAMEYVIFREGKPRNFADLTDDEIYFTQSVAADLYLSACRLEAAWAGIDNVKASRKQLLEEEEMEPENNFGDEMINAGKAGSRWSSVTLASVQILEGCQDIIGEVADSKIAAAHDGEDTNYIESPHAYNSVQDFYDNILSCKHALYGGMTINGTTPDANSLMAFCLSNYPNEAKEVTNAMEEALTKINAMKRPFVIYYSDPSAGDAIEALHDLDDAIDALKKKLND